MALKGQIEVELAGKVGTTKQGGLRTTFSATPDAPFTKFVLNLQGGKKGLLINSRNLCKAKPKAFARLVGQNGKATATAGNPADGLPEVGEEKQSP